MFLGSPVSDPSHGGHKWDATSTQHYVVAGNSQSGPQACSASGFPTESSLSASKLARELTISLFCAVRCARQKGRLMDSQPELTKELSYILIPRSCSPWSCFHFLPDVLQGGPSSFIPVNGTNAAKGQETKEVILRGPRFPHDSELSQQHC